MASDGSAGPSNAAPAIRYMKGEVLLGPLAGKGKEDAEATESDSEPVYDDSEADADENVSRTLEDHQTHAHAERDAVRDLLPVVAPHVYQPYTIGTQRRQVVDGVVNLLAVYRERMINARPISAQEILNAMKTQRSIPLEGDVDHSISYDPTTRKLTYNEAFSTCMSRDTSVYVVAIIGDQGSGKSTILNRLFPEATPFVAGHDSRSTTLGQHAALVRIDANTVILVLDVQGRGENHAVDVQLAASTFMVADVIMHNFKSTLTGYMSTLEQFYTPMFAIGDLGGVDLRNDVGKLSLLSRDALRTAPLARQMEAAVFAGKLPQPLAFLGTPAVAKFDLLRPANIDDDGGQENPRLDAAVVDRIREDIANNLAHATPRRGHQVCALLRDALSNATSSGARALLGDPAFVAWSALRGTLLASAREWSAQCRQGKPAEFPASWCGMLREINLQALVVPVDVADVRAFVADLWAIRSSTFEDAVNLALRNLQSAEENRLPRARVPQDVPVLVTELDRVRAKLNEDRETLSAWVTAANASATPDEWATSTHPIAVQLRLHAAAHPLPNIPTAHFEGWVENTLVGCALHWIVHGMVALETDLEIGGSTRLANHWNAALGAPSGRALLQLLSARQHASFATTAGQTFENSIAIEALVQLCARDLPSHYPQALVDIQEAVARYREQLDSVTLSPPIRAAIEEHLGGAIYRHLESRATDTLAAWFERWHRGQQLPINVLELQILFDEWALREVGHPTVTNPILRALSFDRLNGYGLNLGAWLELNIDAVHLQQQEIARRGIPAGQPLPPNAVNSISAAYLDAFFQVSQGLRAWTQLDPAFELRMSQEAVDRMVQFFADQGWVPRDGHLNRHTQRPARVPRRARNVRRAQATRHSPRVPVPPPDMPPGPSGSDFPPPPQPPGPVPAPPGPAPPPFNEAAPVLNAVPPTRPAAEEFQMPDVEFHTKQGGSNMFGARRTRKEEIVLKRTGEVIGEGSHPKESAKARKQAMERAEARERAKFDQRQLAKTIAFEQADAAFKAASAQHEADTAKYNEAKSHSDAETKAYNDMKAEYQRQAEEHRAATEKYNADKRQYDDDVEFAQKVDAVAGAAFNLVTGVATSQAQRQAAHLLVNLDKLSVRRLAQSVSNIGIDTVLSLPDAALSYALCFVNPFAPAAYAMIKAYSAGSSKGEVLFAGAMGVMGPVAPVASRVIGMGMDVIAAVNAREARDQFLASSIRPNTSWHHTWAPTAAGLTRVLMNQEFTRWEEGVRAALAETASPLEGEDLFLRQELPDGTIGRWIACLGAAARMRHLQQRGNTLGNGDSGLVALLTAAARNEEWQIPLIPKIRGVARNNDDVYVLVDGARVPLHEIDADKLAKRLGPHLVERAITACALQVGLGIAALQECCGFMCYGLEPSAVSVMMCDPDEVFEYRIAGDVFRVPSYGLRAVLMRWSMVSLTLPRRATGVTSRWTPQRTAGDATRVTWYGEPVGQPFRDAMEEGIVQPTYDWHTFMRGLDRSRNKSLSRLPLVAVFYAEEVRRHPRGVGELCNAADEPVHPPFRGYAYDDEMRADRWPVFPPREASLRPEQFVTMLQADGERMLRKPPSLLLANERPRLMPVAAPHKGVRVTLTPAIVATPAAWETAMRGGQRDYDIDNLLLFPRLPDLTVSQLFQDVEQRTAAAIVDGRHATISRLIVPTHAARVELEFTRGTFTCPPHIHAILVRVMSHVLSAQHTGYVRLMGVAARPIRTGYEVFVIQEGSQELHLGEFARVVQDVQQDTEPMLSRDILAHNAIAQVLAARRAWPVDAHVTLTMENIVVERVADDADATCSVGDTQFVVPNVGVRIKLIGLDIATFNIDGMANGAPIRYRYELDSDAYPWRAWERELADMLPDLHEDRMRITTMTEGHDVQIFFYQLSKHPLFLRNSAVHAYQSCYPRFTPSAVRELQGIASTLVAPGSVAPINLNDYLMSAEFLQYRLPDVRGWQQMVAEKEAIIFLPGFEGTIDALEQRLAAPGATAAELREALLAAHARLKTTEAFQKARQPDSLARVAQLTRRIYALLQRIKDMQREEQRAARNN